MRLCVSRHAGQEYEDHEGEEEGEMTWNHVNVPFTNQAIEVQRSTANISCISD
jgi:hypothetical protein